MIRKGSIFNNPQCFTRSAFDRNLNARASSRKPSTTFTVVNHPPDLGIEFIQPGNAANRAKGKARANPKPPIPAVSCQAPPSELRAPASKDPRIGPVQENDTRASVNAMKNIPKNPPMPSADATLLEKLLGKEIS